MPRQARLDARPPRLTEEIGGQIFNLDKSNCENFKTPAFVKKINLTPESYELHPEAIDLWKI